LRVYLDMPYKEANRNEAKRNELIAPTIHAPSRTSPAPKPLSKTKLAQIEPREEKIVPRYIVVTYRHISYITLSISHITPHHRPKIPPPKLLSFPIGGNCGGPILFLFSLSNPPFSLGAASILEGAASYPSLRLRHLSTSIPATTITNISASAIASDMSTTYPFAK